jgi:hypothetical protein
MPRFVAGLLFIPGFIPAPFFQAEGVQRDIQCSEQMGQGP